MTTASQSSAEGHRARLRARYLLAPSALSDVEILELLLTFAIPRREVRSLAEALLARFGDLQGVLAADALDLARIPGIGETATTLLRLVGWLAHGQTRPAERESPTRSPIVESSPVAEAPAPSGRGGATMRVFADDETANTIAVLPTVGELGSYEALKAHLREHLPYNSASTRQRRANHILDRFFPHGTVNTPLAYYAQHCGSPADLRAALFYETLAAEPLAARVAEEVVWPGVAQGYVTREAIRERVLQYRPDLRDASQEKTLRAILNTYSILGVAEEADGALRLRIREGTPEAFLYVFFALYSSPGVYTFSQLEQGPMRQWLLWDRDWMRRQIYALRDCGLVAKVSEIDTIRQFTTTIGQMDALAAYFQAHGTRSLAPEPGNAP